MKEHKEYILEEINKFCERYYIKIDNIDSLFHEEGYLKYSEFDVRMLSSGLLALMTNHQLITDLTALQERIKLESIIRDKYPEVEKQYQKYQTMINLLK